MPACLQSQLDHVWDFWSLTMKACVVDSHPMFCVASEVFWIFLGESVYCLELENSNTNCCQQWTQECILEAIIVTSLINYTQNPWTMALPSCCLLWSRCLSPAVNCIVVISLCMPHISQLLCVTACSWWLPANIKIRNHATHFKITCYNTKPNTKCEV